MSDVDLILESRLHVTIMEPTAHREGREHGIPTTLIQMYDSAADSDEAPNSEGISLYMDDNKLLLSTIRVKDDRLEKANHLIIRPEVHKWSFAALGKAIADYVDKRSSLPNGILQGVELITLRRILGAASGSQAPRPLSFDKPSQCGAFSVTANSHLALAALIAEKPETAREAFADHFDVRRLLTTRNATVFAWETGTANAFYELSRVVDGPDSFKECTGVWKATDFESGDLVTRELNKRTISLKEQDHDRELSELLTYMRKCLSEITADTGSGSGLPGRMTLFAFPPEDIEGTQACLAVRNPTLTLSEADHESTSADDATDVED